MKNVCVLQIFHTLGTHLLRLNLHILWPWKTSQDIFPLAERAEEGTTSEDRTEKVECTVN